MQVLSIMSILRVVETLTVHAWLAAGITVLSLCSGIANFCVNCLRCNIAVTSFGCDT